MIHDNPKIAHRLAVYLRKHKKTASDRQEESGHQIPLHFAGIDPDQS